MRATLTNTPMIDDHKAMTTTASERTATSASTRAHSGRRCHVITPAKMKSPSNAQTTPNTRSSVGSEMVHGSAR